MPPRNLHPPPVQVNAERALPPGGSPGSAKDPGETPKSTDHSQIFSRWLQRPARETHKAQIHFLAAFRQDPHTPAPKVRTAKVPDFHEWKAERRAYDAARMDLHLATPQQIQAQNAAICVPQGGGRIVRHAWDVRATAHAR